MIKKTVLLMTLSFLLFSLAGQVGAATKVRGIYINQGTLENTNNLKNLIQEAKEAGINAFVIDLEKVTRNYEKNVKMVKDNGIKYIARVVVFPDGGKAEQIKSNTYWMGRYKLVENAIKFGADEIQLDYIRYNTKQPPSAQNAHDVKAVIKWFKTQVSAHNVPLQVDIFGEVSFKESPRIGQNIQLFADTIDVACPMVYPSHYHPYQKHSRTPYETVYKSVTALKTQFASQKMPFQLHPFIEASNYHYKMSTQQRSLYVLSQIRAVEDANADGWYVWSPKNHYGSLFTALKNRNTMNEKSKQPIIQ